MIDRNEQLSSELDYLKPDKPAPAPGPRPPGASMMTRVVRTDDELAKREAWLAAYRDHVRATGSGRGFRFARYM